MEKVCVRVPKTRREDLLKFAEKLRTEESAKEPYRGPGWDAQAISAVVKQYFGSDKKMFEHFGWPEAGSSLMPMRGKNIKKKFGSTEAFLKEFPVKGF